MPTYEYVCKKCGHEFEQFQSITAKPLVTCSADTCGQKKWGRGKVQRKLSAGAGLIFKGSGFYITDYRSEGYKQAAKKDSESSKPASKSSETKSSSTDSKPAAKPAKPAAKS